MRRSFVYALALAGVSASAHAADLDLGGMKDPLPDTLTYQGVTIYGTVDVGYAYQTNGRPLGSVVSDLEYSPFTTTRNYTGQSISTLQANALEQSKIGVKIEKGIGSGWTAVGKLETGFDPITGQLSDGCSSFIQNAGVNYNQQTSNADSGRCGQAFNGVSYAGLSNPSYGTLTVGRQQSFQLDGMASYDPMALSYALSLMGYSGTWGGSGSTQAARWDNSAKYVYQYGPVHAGVMYSSGGDGTGLYGNGYGANVGAAYMGFSIDGYYTKEYGAVNLLSTGSNNYPTPAPSGPIVAAVSNNEAWSLMGKYTYDFSGGFKDAGPGAKLTLFAGYTHIGNSNSNDNVSEAAGGYNITVLSDFFTTTKVLQEVWTGAKYELSSGWSFTGAFYHVDQNAWVGEAGGDVCTAGGATRIECAGTYNQGSFLIDYAFNKHFDVYTGVTYAIVSDGLAAGYSGTPCGVHGVSGGCNAGELPGTKTSIDTASVVTGIRLRF